jgi:hypothetical protein
MADNGSDCVDERGVGDGHLGNDARPGCDVATAYARIARRAQQRTGLVG